MISKMQPVMNGHNQGLDQVPSISTKRFDAAASLAGRKAIASHHREGRSVPIWRDGRIMYLNPDGSVTGHNPTPEAATTAGIEE